MKKSKRFLALATATVLSLSSFVTAFAADSEFVKVYEGIGYIVNTADGESPDDMDKVYQLDGGIAGSTQDEPDYDNINYGDLKFTETSFYVDDNFVLGSYPAVDGSSALNSKMKSDLSRYYERFKSYKGADFIKSIYANASLNSYFHVGYLVTNEGRYAKIDLTITLQENFEDITGKKVQLTYYVDKASYDEVSEDAYLKGLKAQAEAAEEAATEETESNETSSESSASTETVRTVPLRAYAEKMGYVIGWKDNGPDDRSTTISDKEDNVIVSFKIGVDAYEVDGEVIELGYAPTLVDSTAMVPSSLFTEILGEALSFDSEGNAIFG